MILDQVEIHTSTRVVLHVHDKRQEQNCCSSGSVSQMTRTKLIKPSIKATSIVLQAFTKESWNASQSTHGIWRKYADLIFTAIKDKVLQQLDSRGSITQFWQCERFVSTTHQDNDSIWWHLQFGQSQVWNIDRCPTWPRQIDSSMYNERVACTAASCG